jgi:hypothetical protein
MTASNEDKTRDKYDSIQTVIDIVARMVNDLGYTEDEAWEAVSNRLLNDLETHKFERKSERAAN